MHIAISSIYIYIHFCNFCLEGESDSLLTNKGGWSLAFKLIDFDKVEIHGR